MIHNLEFFATGLATGATLVFIYKTWIVNTEKAIVAKTKELVHNEIDKFKGMASNDKQQLKNKIEQVLK